jgi:hypothetical protein
MSVEPTNLPQPSQQAKLPRTLETVPAGAVKVRAAVTQEDDPPEITSQA